MKRQERRGLEGDGSLSNASWTEEDRPESAQQPVARRQVRRPLASTAQDDQLLLEQEILRHHRSHTTGATELRGHDGQVKQGEQEVPHAAGQRRSDVGRRATLPNPGFGARIPNSRRTAADRRCDRELVGLEAIAERTRPRASHEETAQDRLQNPITVHLSIVACRIEWRELARKSPECP